MPFKKGFNPANSGISFSTFHELHHDLYVFYCFNPANSGISFSTVGKRKPLFWLVEDGFNPANSGISFSTLNFTLMAFILKHCFNPANSGISFSTRYARTFCFVVL